MLCFSDIIMAVWNIHGVPSAEASSHLLLVVRFHSCGTRQLQLSIARLYVVSRSWDLPIVKQGSKQTNARNQTENAGGKFELMPATTHHVCKASASASSLAAGLFLSQTKNSRTKGRS